MKIQIELDFVDDIPTPKVGFNVGGELLFSVHDIDKIKDYKTGTLMGYRYRNRYFSSIENLLDDMAGQIKNKLQSLDI